jgi:4-hydroxy-3-methylbut-2-enyl diphosphate reductase
MNCKVGEHAGFCFGANRAVESLEDALKENKPIYTFGPILNNDILVESYRKRGVTVVEDVEEFDKLEKGKIIIRSHGVGRDIYEHLLATGFEIFDATCPFVKRIHRIVEKQSQLGDKIVVVGNPNHPEVMGIVGWADGDAYVVEKEEDIDKLNFEKSNKITLVSQTTFNRNKFQELVEIFEKRSYNIDVMNTICDATRVRQEEADALSKEADVMIVIGDKKSSNSRKLYDICKANCDQTFFIQTLEDIKGRLNVVSNLVGITAGASTPKYIIEEVQKYVRNDF